MLKYRKTPAYNKLPNPGNPEYPPPQPPQKEGGYSGFPGMIEWATSSPGRFSLSGAQNPPKISRASRQTKKIPGPKISPQKSRAEFPNLKNLQKALNDVTRKVW